MTTKLLITVAFLLVAIVAGSVAFLRNKKCASRGRRNIHEQPATISREVGADEVKQEIERLAQRYIAYLVGEEMIRRNVLMARREAFWKRYPREDAEPVCDVGAIARKTGLDLIQVNKCCIRWIEDCGCEVKGSVNVALENAIKRVVSSEVSKLIARIV